MKSEHYTKNKMMIKNNLPEKDENLIETNWGNFRQNGFENRQLKTPIGELNYYQAGAGVPIVLVHGLGGGASCWSWSYVARLLTGHNKVVVPDLVGWGLSEHPERFLQFDDYVISVEALLEELGGGAIVVAQSLSAGFMLALAEKRPELIKKLILTNPTGLNDFGKETLPFLAKLLLAPLAENSFIGLRFYKLLFHRRSFMADWYKRFGFYDPNAVPTEIVDNALYSAMRPNAAYSALPFVSGSVHYDIVPYIKRTQVPTSIIAGKDPNFVGVRNAQRLSAVRPDIKTDYVENTKACSELERPAEVAKLILDVINPNSIIGNRH